MYFHNVYVLKYRRNIKDHKLIIIFCLISIIVYTLTFNLSYQEQTFNLSYQEEQQQQQSTIYVISYKENDIPIHDIADTNIHNNVKSSISSTITFNKVFINIVSNVRGPHGGQPQPITIILYDQKETNYISKSITLPPFADYLKDPVGFNVPKSFISIGEKFKVCALYHNIKERHFSSNPFVKCQEHFLDKTPTYYTFIMPCLKSFSNTICKD